jgi:hypothetical protein
VAASPLSAAARWLQRPPGHAAFALVLARGTVRLSPRRPTDSLICLCIQARLGGHLSVELPRAHAIRSLSLSER